MGSGTIGGHPIYTPTPYCHLFNFLLLSSSCRIWLETTNYTYHTPMRKTYIYIPLITLFLVCSLQSAAKPRLSIIAVVDGMTTENLNMLRPYWQQGGMRTLSEEAYQTTITFPHLVFGGNETTATLMTGVTPDRHGYTMDAYYSRRDRKVYTMLEDKEIPGIGTSLCLSPKALLSPTISDRMRLLHPKAKIYAIGIQPETTILLAGHTANACCWIDNNSKQWVTTTAYREGLPGAAYEQNRKNRITTLAEQQWTPRIDIHAYNHPTPQEKKKPFAYNVGNILPHAPQANKLVIELGLDLQLSEHLGVDNHPDLLFLQLNSLTPKAKTDQIRSAEQEDMYLHLNQDLGFLMEQLDRRIGRENYQLIVVGRPVLGIDLQTLADIHMPVRQFNVDRAAALIGTYLMAIYGHERWVDGGYGQSIFLNRTLIEQKRLNLETIQRQVANFLMDFEGVEVAMPAYEALFYPTLQNSFCKRHMGDIVFTLQSGWQLMKNEKHAIDHVIDEKPSAPLLFWSGTLRPMPQGQLTATDIADLLFQ